MSRMDGAAEQPGLAGSCQRRVPTPARPGSAGQHLRAGRRLALALAGLLVAGCANFSAAAPTFTIAPSLTPAQVSPVLPTPRMIPPPSPSAPSSPTPPSSGPQSPPGSSGPPSDPCVPTDPAVIAACLDAPWGLVPLADGLSALVGERRTGRILRVAYQRKPVLVATVPGIDPAGGGGLLGLAVSPSYDEDGLLYAYVSTATDNRIVRIAAGGVPKPIFTGIPRGSRNNGGPITFDGRYLLVATGDTGRPALAGSVSSLAGKVLRLDEFGHPAGFGSGTLPDPGAPLRSPGPDPSPAPGPAPGPSVLPPSPGTSPNPGSGPGSGSGSGSGSAPATGGGSGPSLRPGAAASPVLVSGLTQPTGICALPTGSVAVIDHRGGADLLLPLRPGALLATPAPGDALWTWPAAGGGAVDCAYDQGALVSTSLSTQRLTGLTLSAQGAFSGTPQTLLDKRYGRLLTVTTGPRHLFWMTTSNKDGQGKPVPADDRVIVLPSNAAGSGGGPD